jgi:hypothetical protein
MRIGTALVAILGPLLGAVWVIAAEQETFPSPDAATRALEAAVRASDPVDRLSAILGPEGDEVVSSGDPVDDAATRERFATAAAKRRRIELSDDGASAILHVGKDDWPFPIPLVRGDDGWRFDTAAGREELLNRRIGRNELTALSVCRTYVDAQIEYFWRSGAYAQSLRSSPGKQDGLYWEAADGDESPLGPLIASATAEGYRVPEGDAPRIPYHGYFFRVLTRQGKHGPGGARNYVLEGEMVGGFALVAWPADHGSSGVMTFLVADQGVVFQKNLGEGTSAAVEAMTAYDPDPSWEPTR